MASPQGFSLTSATPVSPRTSPALPAPGCPHALQPIRHRPAPAADHRRTHAHEPYLPTADAVAAGFRGAVGAAGPQIYQATASPAPAQNVARRILGEDVTQIEVYTERVKRMVGKVHLQRHHPLREGQLCPGGREGAELQRARRAADALPPAPRCRGGVQRELRNSSTDMPMSLAIRRSSGGAISRPRWAGTVVQRPRASRNCRCDPR